MQLMGLRHLKQLLKNIEIDKLKLLFYYIYLKEVVYVSNSFTKKKFREYLLNETHKTDILYGIEDFLYAIGLDNVMNKEEYKDLFHRCDMEKVLETSSALEDAECAPLIDGYENISDCIMFSSLKQREKFNIMMEIIEINANKSIQYVNGKEYIAIKATNLARKKVNDKQFDFLVREGGIEYLLKNDPENLTEEQNQLRKIVEEIIAKADKEKGKKFMDHHFIIKNKYIDKKQDYSEEDVEDIINLLSDVGVNNEMCKLIKRYLIQDIKKRKKIEIHFNESNSHKNNFVSDKEYKEIIKELKKYIDIYNMVPIKEMTEEEVYYCAYLLLKIGTKESLVRSLFDRCLKRDKDNNYIGLYNKNYKKVLYYKDRLMLDESINNINDYLKEIFLAPDTDYQFWKEQIGIELTTLMSKLPNSFEYEIEKAKTYRK